MKQTYTPAWLNQTLPPCTDKSDRHLNSRIHQSNYYTVYKRDNDCLHGTVYTGSLCCLYVITTFMNEREDYKRRFIKSFIYVQRIIDPKCQFLSLVNINIGKRSITPTWPCSVAPNIVCFKMICKHGIMQTNPNVYCISTTKKINSYNK